MKKWVIGGLSAIVFTLFSEMALNILKEFNIMHYHPFLVPGASILLILFIYLFYGTIISIKKSIMDHNKDNYQEKIIEDQNAQIRNLTSLDQAHRKTSINNSIMFDRFEGLCNSYFVCIDPNNKERVRQAREAYDRFEKSAKDIYQDAKGIYNRACKKFCVSEV